MVWLTIRLSAVLPRATVVDSRSLDASAKNQNQRFRRARRHLDRGTLLVCVGHALFRARAAHSARAVGTAHLSARAAGHAPRTMGRAHRGGAAGGGADLHRHGRGGLDAHPAARRSGDEAARIQGEHRHQDARLRRSEGRCVYEALGNGRGTEE